MLKCRVQPIGGYDAELSYRVKCVAVESERVFGDVVVTRRTSAAELSSCYQSRRPNLIQQYLEGPNFLELNRPTRRQSVTVIHKADDGQFVGKIARSKSLDYPPMAVREQLERQVQLDDERRRRTYPPPLPKIASRQEIVVVSSLVDQLLVDIYGSSVGGEQVRSESESTTSSLKLRQHQRPYLQRKRLELKSAVELRILLGSLREHISQTGGLLLRQLRRRDYLQAKHERLCDFVTAHLQAHSSKQSEDTRMRFSLTPQPGESGFIQWLDAMKMVAKLQGGIPAEFRRKLWLTLAERHLEQRGVDWEQAEKLCFNEWSNPDDEELGIQIVKDLHRTGCSLFCGAAGRDNQAVLRRVLLGFARWNKSVGYCQGLNVLAALILQVVDRDEAAAVKVMIYLIEGVLPEGYFADSLRGLSIDMAVFRDLLRMRVPRLSKHLESLQNKTKDKTTGSSYEPPLTNVFTMQWFLTLFCHCLPQNAVLRVWDLIFLEGDDVLLRTALAIWEGISDRVMTVTSADEFYSIMGVLTREMLEFTDTNQLIRTIVAMGPLHGVTNLREKHRYNITPWARRLSDDDDSDTEDDERLAVAAAAAMFSMSRLKKSERTSSSINVMQAVAPTSDRERLALDISTLKQQYAKLRERQRQAHIILSAACARQTMGPTTTATQAMNHLLVGKSALVSGKNRPLGPPPGSLAARVKAATALHTSPRPSTRKDRQQQQQQGVTIHWKDMKKRKDEHEACDSEAPAAAEQQADVVNPQGSMSSRLSSSGGGGTALDSDSDSTSTELCDEPDRLSDVDSEEMTSTSDCCVMPSADDDRRSPAEQQRPPSGISNRLVVSKEETSIAEITDQIRRLSAGDADFKTSLDGGHPGEVKKSSDPSGIFDIGKSCDDKKSLDFEENNPASLDTGYSIEPNKGAAAITRSLDMDYSMEDKKPSTCISSSFDSSYLLNDKISATDNSATIDHDVSETFDGAWSYDFLGTKARLESDVNVSVPSVARGDGGDNKEVGSSEITYSSKASYVIGHLPVAPVSFETRKSSKLSPVEVFSSRVETRSKIERDNFSSSLDASILSPEVKFSSYKIQSELKRSPKTPESAKSFSSGETMGPDSITSSLVVSPRTPLRSESRNFLFADKSITSSISSDSKTLTLTTRSIESEAAVIKPAVGTPGDKSVTPSTDSLMQPKSTEPPCSSTESFCSPTKPKSSERSFSSDLQSPVSANSIKYTANYSYKSDGLELQKTSNEVSAVTSPFYPILNPNQKTPSPYGEEKRQKSKDSLELEEFRGIKQENVTKSYSGTKTPTQAFDISRYETADENISIKVSMDNDSFSGSSRKLYSFELEDDTKPTEIKASNKDIDHSTGTIAFEISRKNKFEDDTLSPLPRNQFEHRSDIFERNRGRSLDGKLETLEISGKSFERSSSSLEKRFPDMLLSPSMEDFANNIKKRSSDVLEDLRHLEAKTTEDGEIDPSMLTRKTSFIWEDLKSLEARRQDTFSDSASGFSRRRIEVPGISISAEGRKTYIVEPKINIDESNDSILKAVTYKSSNGTSHDDDDDGESKLGVWTKVKPRKRNDNGRRSSDRALKIIQENSAILQKILTCQARKRLPDLEEITKEITISPINEEISKIFSPILEKMGLNEHEINEELARINFRDLDRNTTTTTASEFEAKINDELSKLSLIGDNDEVAYLPDVNDLSSDYLVEREAFIDRQINEELSKLLANYEQDSPVTLQKRSSSLNASDDLSTCSTNVYSYKSSNDSLDMKSDHGFKEPMHTLIYSDNPLPYVPRNDYSTSRDLSAKNDVDIYRELEKLDQISYAQALPSVSAELTHQDIIQPSIPYISEIMRSPKIDYPSTVIEKQPTYDISPLKSPYDSSYTSSTLETSSYDYKSRISPRKTPSNPYSVRSYDTKSSLDTGFENSTFELTSRKAIVPTTLNYEYGPKKHILSKEHLEFRVKYDQEEDLTICQKSTARDIDLKLSPFQTNIAELDKGASYYTNKQVITPTNKYASSNDDMKSLTSSLERGNYESNFQRRKYDKVSPLEEYSTYSENYDSLRQPYKVTTLDSEAEISSYLSSSSISSTSRHREPHALSPHYQYGDYTKSLSSSYATVSPNFDDSLTSTTTRTKTTYSDITPTDTLSYRMSTKLTLGNLEETKTVGDSGVKYNFDRSPSPKSLGFNPFPVRNTPRKPKELGLKLGLYSSTNSNQSKRS